MHNEMRRPSASGMTGDSSHKFRVDRTSPVSTANVIIGEQMTHSTYPPPRVPCVIGAYTRDRV